MDMDFARNMRLSGAGKAGVFAKEAIVLTRYRDSKNIWTIGVGVTAAAGASINPETFTGKITLDEAFEMFDRVAPKYEDYIHEVVKVQITQVEYDALFSIIWNIGPKPKSKTPLFIKRLNKGDRPGAARAIMNWKKPPEIIERREAEQRWFRDGIYPAPKCTIYEATNKGRVIWSSGKRLDLSHLLDEKAPRRPAPAKRDEANEWWRDDDQVEALQQRLKDLGYTEVGEVDGKWGSYTKGALLRFKADNDLPLTMDMNDEVKAALFTAKKCGANIERKGKAPPSSRISNNSAGQILTGGGLATGGAVTAATGDDDDAGSAGDKVNDLVDKAEEIKQTADRVGGVMEWITDNPLVHLFNSLGPVLPYLVLVAGGLAVYFGWRARQARIEDYQTGKTR